jgi:hypothetical protein
MCRSAKMREDLPRINSNKILIRIKKKTIILIMDNTGKVVMKVMIYQNKLVINIIKLVVKNIMIYSNNNKKLNPIKALSNNNNNSNNRILINKNKNRKTIMHNIKVVQILII